MEASSKTIYHLPITLLVYQLTQSSLQYTKSVLEKLPQTVLSLILMDLSIKLMDLEHSQMDLKLVESMMFGDIKLKKTTRNQLRSQPRKLTSTTISQSSKKLPTAIKVHSTLVITPNKLEEETGIKMVKIPPTSQLTPKTLQLTIVPQLLILFTKRAKNT
jgi:hypothetical protein